MGSYDVLSCLHISHMEHSYKNLIDDDNCFRISVLETDNLKKDGDMFFTRICESIIWLSIEASDHESFIFWWKMTLHSICKIRKRNHGNQLLVGRDRFSLNTFANAAHCPLYCTPSAASENCGYILLPVYDTVPGFGEFTIMNKYSLSTLGFPAVRIAPFWYNSLFPVLLGNTREKWKDIAYGQLERCGHKIGENYCTIAPPHQPQKIMIVQSFRSFCSGISFCIREWFYNHEDWGRESGVGEIESLADLYSHFLT